MKTLPALNTNHNQKVGITRRDFVKGLGSVIGLQLAWPLDSVFGQIVPNTCFVGVGVHGYSVAKELVHSFDDPEDAFAPSVFVFERDCSRIPEHVSAESIVVLCGAVELRGFAARELDVLRGDLRAACEFVCHERVLRFLDAVGDACVVNLSVDNGEKTADERVVALNIERDLLAEQLFKMLLDGLDLFFAERAGGV